MAHTKIVSAINDINFIGPIYAKTMTLSERKQFLSDRFSQMQVGEISERELMSNMESIDSILN